MKAKIIIATFALALFTTMSFAQRSEFGTSPFDPNWSDKLTKIDDELAKINEKIQHFNEQMVEKFGVDVPFFDRGWQRRIPPKLYEELKLTDEQKSKLENLYFEFRKNRAEIAGKLNKARIELQELLSAEKPDKSAVDRKVDEISGYTRELFKNRVNYWYNILQVLTPEQKKILKEKLGYRHRLGFGVWGRGLRLRLHRW